MKIQLSEQVRISGVTFELSEVEAKCLAYFTINRNQKALPTRDGVTFSAGLNVLLKMTKAIQEVYKDDPEINPEEIEETRQSAQASRTDAPTETEQDGTSTFRTSLQVRTEGQ